jgi:hypothetical protein
LVEVKSFIKPEPHTSPARQLEKEVKRKLQPNFHTFRYSCYHWLNSTAYFWLYLPGKDWHLSINA